MSKHLPILTFHSIDSSGSAVSVSAEQLRGLLETLLDNGYVGCSLSEALVAAPDGRQHIALCFDDGYENVLDAGLPILAELGFTATVFAITDHVGSRTGWPGQPREFPDAPLLGWAGLERLLTAGWEVGAHGRSHRPLTRLEEAAIEAECEGAHEAISARLGIGPRTFAYPYGDHDARVAAVCGRCYEAAVGTRLAVASAADLRDGFRLPRVDAYYVRERPWLLGSRLSILRSWLALRRPPRALRKLIAADLPA